MRTRTLMCAIFPLFATMAISCNSEGDTTIINGVDCGLIRDDLVGSWTVSLDTAARTLQSCTGTDPGLDGTGVATDDFPATYSPMDVFGSDGSTSFKLSADRTGPDNDTLDPELTGSVQADSCLAILRVWAKTDVLFFQCIGFLDLSSHMIGGSCDSAEIDSDGIGGLDTSCSLNSPIGFEASVN